MPEFRIYRVLKGGHFNGAPEIIDCSDESEALQKAQQAVDGHDIELWEGDRLLCRLPRDS